MTLRPNSVVESVLYDAATGRASGVRVIDAVTMQPTEYRARLVFLCASALESTRILLNSKSEHWPDGLANASGALGRNVMDHCFGSGARGTMPGMEDQASLDSRPNGVYVPRFRNVKDAHPKFVRGYGFQGGAWRSGWGRGGLGFGAAHKNELIKAKGPWQMSLGGWSEMLPRADNLVDLDPAVKDKWGIPALRVNCTFGENERAILEDVQQTAAEMLEAAGAKDISTYNSQLPPGLCIHEMGTARMGRDRKTSGLNGWNQAHDVPNLLITDGACIASSANQNPSITYMALTARAVAHVVDLLNRRDL